MALRHVLLRFTPRLDGRVVLATLALVVLVVAGTFIRWGGPAPPLDLLALGPEGQFLDSIFIPVTWGDTRTATSDAVIRVPLILGVRNQGRRPVRPERLSLSVPVRYRIVTAGDRELDVTLDPGSPLATYTLRPGLHAVEPGRLPAMLPAHDTLWLEVVVPSYYCVSLADSIPDFVPAPAPPVHSMSDIRIFYSFDGGDLRQRRTGTLAVRLDTTLLDMEVSPQPPSFPMETAPETAQPDLGTLLYVGSRSSRCGEPEAPMELLSTVWETAAGGRFITVDYGGKVRKHLYDLNGDGVIERESWAPGADGRFIATRRAQLPIPAFLLPRPTGMDYDMARIDSLPADSVARLDPFRRAMRGPGDVPGGGAGPAADSARRERVAAPPRQGAVVPRAAEPAPVEAAEPAPVEAADSAPVEAEPERRVAPQPLGTPVTLPPDTGGG